MNKYIEKLFSPFKINNLEIPNRIVMAPMTRSKSPNSIPGEDVSMYYSRRAENGVGLIITEGTTVNTPMHLMILIYHLFMERNPYWDGKMLFRMFMMLAD